MKFKLPEALKKPALTAVENLLEKQVEENFDHQADKLIEALKKLAGSNKIISGFLDSMAPKAKSEAKAAIMKGLDKIDGVPHDEEKAV